MIFFSVCANQIGRNRREAAVEKETGEYPGKKLNAFEARVE